MKCLIFLKIFLASNLSMEENTTSLEGLNPQFVDVDHDLDLPTGNEGPDPVFVMPPGGENLTLDTGKCKHCY